MPGKLGRWVDLSGSHRGSHGTKNVRVRTRQPPGLHGARGAERAPGWPLPAFLLGMDSHAGATTPQAWRREPARHGPRPCSSQRTPLTVEEANAVVAPIGELFVADAGASSATCARAR